MQPGLATKLMHVRVKYVAITRVSVGASGWAAARARPIRTIARSGSLGPQRPRRVAIARDRGVLSGKCLRLALPLRLAQRGHLRELLEGQGESTKIDEGDAECTRGFAGEEWIGHPAGAIDELFRDRRDSVASPRGSNRTSPGATAPESSAEPSSAWHNAIAPS